jgi:ribonuclease P protein component
VVSSPGPAGPPRLGLIVGRSCGPAVVRNRIKRRLRASARGVELEPGTDYVIIATREVAEAPFDRLTGWLERAVADRAHA